MNLVEQIAQLVDHVEIMQLETAKQSKVCSDKIAVNNRSLNDFIGEFKRKHTNNVRKNRQQKQDS